MSTTHTDERIGEAWRLHRSGNNRASIEIFEDVLAKNPKHLDALYGVGLARRAEGENDGAVQAFQKALELAKEAFDAVDVTSVVDGHHGSNDLGTYDDDRYLMLQRMIGQRLKELGV